MGRVDSALEAFSFLGASGHAATAGGAAAKDGVSTGRARSMERGVDQQAPDAHLWRGAGAERGWRMDLLSCPDATVAIAQALGWLRAGPPAEAADCQKRANMRD